MKYIKLFENYDKEGTIVYLHGLKSEPGFKAKWLDTVYDNVISPSIHYTTEASDQIFNDLYDELKNRNVTAIIGSSMGGYYAYWLCKKLGVPGILFNPALDKRSMKMPIDKTGIHDVKYDIILGMNDDVVDPNRTMDWLTQQDHEYNIHQEEIGHRIPGPIFKKYAILASKTVK